jgi:DNA polymerase I-like protein with 3'-5' exonuclease and polymerase domains
MTDRTTVRLPPASVIALSERHDKYRLTMRNNMPPEFFAYEVGTFLSPLPEKDLGNPMHLPVVRLNTIDGLGFGWNVADFMLVLPAVNDTDLQFGTCMSDTIGQWLKEQMRGVGFDTDQCLATHALRFPKPMAKAYGVTHKTEGGAFVRADCYACRPKVIITFGAPSLKALFGSDAKLDSYRGAVYEWEGIPVVPTVSPYVFISSHGGLDVFQSELWRAMEVTLKGYVPGAQMNSAMPVDDWRILETAEAVEEFEASLHAGNHRQLAIDCEFGNDTARQEDNYLLSMQVSWGPETGAFIKLRDEGGKVRYTDSDRSRIHASITRMMRRSEVRLGGHHLRTDVDMPYREGMDFDDKLETGFDTMLAYHLLHGGSGDEGQGLDHLVRKYVPHYGAYWKPLEDWLDSDPVGPVWAIDPLTDQRSMSMKPRGRKQILRFGYRDIPYEILIPYALKDASATWIAWQEVEKELERKPKLKTLFENIVMPASLHLMDVQRQGIRQDRARIKQLREIYQPEYDSMLQEFRSLVNWPGFNPGSWQQKAYFLHHTTPYSGRDEFKATHVLPEGVKLLGLTPLITTGKYPKDWAQIASAGEQGLYVPSTKGDTLNLLFNQHKDIPELKLLKNLSVLGKFLNTYLMEPEINEFGVAEGGKAVCDNMWKDGRVRGSLFQTSETGRYRMRAPNLQCNPKKQEDAALSIFIERRFDGMTLAEYRYRTDDRPTSKCPPADRIAPEDRLKIPTVKSAFIPEEGWVFIEADFKTAEIAIWAYCSGDQTLIDIIEQDRDLHAETATKAFGLPVLEELTAALAELKATGKMKRYKAWVDSVKSLYNNMRDAAKAVFFGIMYGKSAFSLARDISKTGHEVTVEDCELIIAGIAEAYTKAWVWLQANKASAIERELVETAFGRCRYFPGIQQMSERDQKAAQREASNSPIQGTVADLLAVAGINLYRMRYRTDIGKQIGWRVPLPIHDAFLVEVRKEYAEEMKRILKFCMSTMNKIPGTDKSLGVKTEQFDYRWGEEESFGPAAKAA